MQVILQCPTDSWLNNKQLTVEVVEPHRVLVEDDVGNFYWVWFDIVEFSRFL
jgi:hypothetical protein